MRSYTINKDILNLYFSLFESYPNLILSYNIVYILYHFIPYYFNKNGENASGSQYQEVIKRRFEFAKPPIKSAHLPLKVETIMKSSRPLSAAPRAFWASKYNPQWLWSTTHAPRRQCPMAPQHLHLFMSSMNKKALRCTCGSALPSYICSFHILGKVFQTAPVWRFGRTSGHARCPRTRTWNRRCKAIRYEQTTPCQASS